MRQIAREIGRNPSTVSRELKRNVRAHDRGFYDTVLAHTRAQEKAGRAKTPILARHPELEDLVQKKLQLDWSPEQMAGWLRVSHPERTNWHLCLKTICQALYHAQESGLSRELTRRLRTGRPLRQRRRRPHRRQVRFTEPGRLIGERPPVVDSRSRYGDWEGDLIMGTGARTAVVTLVERRRRLVHLVALPNGHEADALVRALAPVLAPIPAACRHTLTGDQGGKMAHHHLAKYFAEGVFCTKPEVRGRRPRLRTPTG